MLTLSKDFMPEKKREEKKKKEKKRKEKPVRLKT